MTTEVELDGAGQRQLLAGFHGSCSDYLRTGDFGREREPFTWLSASGPDDTTNEVAAALQEFMHERSAVSFEAWELEDEEWRVQFSGKVRVLYAELDSRLLKVRALLQWAPVDSGSVGDSSRSLQSSRR